MFYKNKNIRSNYSVMLGVFIFASIFMTISVVALIYGFITTTKALANVQHIDTALEAEGNLAQKAVYFDITEAPIYLCKAYKKSNYYLLSDGNEYRLAEIKEKEYEKIKSEVEASGTYRIEGVTIYIADSKRRDNVASEASRITGQKIGIISMDDILGGACIECKKLNFWSVYKGSMALLGMIFGVITLPFFWSSITEWRTSRKVISLGGDITARDIDREACEKGAVWLDSLRIYLTQNMVVGVRSEGGSDHEGQVALKYSEVQSIHAYNKVEWASETDSSKKIERYIVEAVATDGQTYILTANKYAHYFDFLPSEREELFKRLLEMNPNVIIQRSADEEKVDEDYDEGYDEDFDEEEGIDEDEGFDEEEGIDEE